MKTIKLSFLINIILVLTLNPNQGYSQESLKDRIIELTFTGGAWLNSPSKIWIGDIGEMSSKSISPLFKLMGDAYINKNFAIGAYINYGLGNTNDLLPDDIKTSIFEFGAGFKPVLYFSDKTCIKIGANVGLRKSFSDYDGTTGRGLGVNCSIEIQHKTAGNGAITIEPGFLSQPTGYADDDTNKYTYAPIFYLNIGYTISAFKK